MFFLSMQQPCVALLSTGPTVWSEGVRRRISSDLPSIDVDSPSVGYPWQTEQFIKSEHVCLDRNFRRAEDSSLNCHWLALVSCRHRLHPVSLTGSLWGASSPVSMATGQLELQLHEALVILQLSLPADMKKINKINC